MLELLTAGGQEELGVGKAWDSTRAHCLTVIRLVGRGTSVCKHPLVHR